MASVSDLLRSSWTEKRPIPGSGSRQPAARAPRCRAHEDRSTVKASLI